MRSQLRRIAEMMQTKEMFSFLFRNIASSAFVFLFLSFFICGSWPMVISKIAFTKILKFGVIRIHHFIFYNLKSLQKENINLIWILPLIKIYGMVWSKRMYKICKPAFKNVNKWNGISYEKKWEKNSCHPCLMMNEYISITQSTISNFEHMFFDIFLLLLHTLRSAEYASNRILIY